MCTADEPELEPILVNSEVLVSRAKFGILFLECSGSIYRTLVLWEVEVEVEVPRTEAGTVRGFRSRGGYCSYPRLDPLRPWWESSGV